MKFFLLDTRTNNLIINDSAILLLREFENLWKEDRNKTKDDKTGKLRSLAYKEFKYIYLMLDWESPYSDYSEHERDKECRADSGLTDEEFNNPLFREACRKYRNIQEENRELKIVKAAQNLVDKLITYLNNVDPTERDAETNKPIFKVKDIMEEIKKTPELIETLKITEQLVRKNQESGPTLREGVTPGFEDVNTEIIYQGDDDEW